MDFTTIFQIIVVVFGFGVGTGVLIIFLMIKYAVTGDEEEKTCIISNQCLKCKGDGQLWYYNEMNVCPDCMGSGETYILGPKTMENVHNKEVFIRNKEAWLYGAKKLGLIKNTGRFRQN